LAVTFVQPQIDGLRKRIAKLPTASSGLGEREIKALAKGLVNYLRTGFAPEMMERLIKPELAARLAALEQRLAALEARPQMSYEGTWDETKAYTAGSFVTHQGGLWVAEDTNIGVRPGAGSRVWRLAVKRGRAER